VLTDPQDARVSATIQTAYVVALHAGVPAGHRFPPATGKIRNDLELPELPGILAAFTYLI
jgi:hypothetical protein